MNPNPIEQAIEARALKLANSRLDDKRGSYEWALDAEITLRECAAALSALRSMPAEPVAWRVHPFDYGVGSEGVHAMTQLHQQRDAWIRKGWNVQPLYTTPPPAPVLSDAEIDAITVAQWGDRVVTAAYRAYARAIEQSVIARGVVRGEL